MDITYKKQCYFLVTTAHCHQIGFLTKLCTQILKRRQNVIKMHVCVTHLLASICDVIKMNTDVALKEKCDPTVIRAVILCYS